ncbi:aminotransferase class IV [Vibrio gazogenes]|uniref:Aminodeoxychorismate lyase n=1 Tax=Vibrio gazogenes DSM 21264 = NBRC 103151 TaxID=1123492 RepID=A0A1M4YT33_VIBGA|nr:aminotransferase class IV [Vibrio gazogenes]USP15089.1 aminotransferase class IV [Vibrio gazogenes]SHF08930.1 branched-chain amino acid aminotransferase [Vibrio gazogenes DSM 21264] [Vibrio gazogenes DSM 21264 = NBRC 103151]
MSSHSFSAHASEEDIRNDSILIYVNGKLVPKEEAMVSVYDSGFMLGDGIWEGLRVYNGQIAFLEDHLDRLYESAKVLDIPLDMPRADLVKALYGTLEANNMVDDAHLRLMVSRGKKRKPFQDPKLTITKPTIVIIAEHSKPSQEVVDKGMSLFTVHVVRGQPNSQDPKLNSHSKLNCITALIQAQKAGADEALMLDPHGFVSTCNSTNFFIIRKGAVWTSSGKYCMNGITRQKVIDVCHANNIPVYEKDFSLFEVYGADEAFTTGTFGGPVPVINIDGRVIGDGVPGEGVMKIRQLYKQLASNLK